MTVWVLWRYKNGSYESIENVAVTPSVAEKDAWILSRSTRDGGWFHGAEEFRLKD